MKRVLLAAIVTCVGCSPVRNPKTGQETGPTSWNEPVRTTDATDVLAEYEENPTAADHRYNDKRWTISGFRVDKIDGRAAIMREGSLGLRLVFPEVSAVIPLRRGTLLRVDCEGDGLSSESVGFEDCEILHRDTPLVSAKPTSRAEEEPEPTEPSAEPSDAESIGPEEPEATEPP